MWQLTAKGNATGTRRRICKRSDHPKISIFMVVQVTKTNLVWGFGIGGCEGVGGWWEGGCQQLLTVGVLKTWHEGLKSHTSKTISFEVGNMEWLRYMS